MELKKDRYYSVTGTTTRGLKIYLPVVIYEGSVRSNVTDVWGYTFRREDNGGMFTFIGGMFTLGACDWAGAARKL